MILGLMSDMHLEYGGFTGPWGNGKVLLLAGDILVSAHLSAVRYLDKFPVDQQDRLVRKVADYDHFFEEAFKHYEHVVIIAGNHEHYGSDVEHTLKAIENRYAKQYPNLHILEKEAIQIDGVLICGATMWTDFNRGDVKTMNTAWGCMNDYQQIWINDAGETRRIKPTEILEDHLEAIRAIKHYTEYAKENGLRMVMVTHHAPSKRSCHPRYAGQYELNGAYQSELEHLMGDPIKLWVHGHTHSSYDYTVGDTRVVCNPRGYWFDDGRALNRDFNPVLEIDLC